MIREFQKATSSTPSVRKYLSSKWIKEDVSRRTLVLDTSLFIHFDDKYFRTEGVQIIDHSLLCTLSKNHYDTLLISLLQGTSCYKYHVEKPVYPGLQLSNSPVCMHACNQEPVESDFLHLYMDLLQALYQIAVLLVFNFDGKRIFQLHNESREHADKIKNTFVFNAFVFCQVRSQEDFSSNIHRFNILLKL